MYMFKVNKETNNFVEGIGFIEDVFEELANKQSKNLHFKINKNKVKNKNEIIITITETNVKKNKQKKQ